MTRRRRAALLAVLVVAIAGACREEDPALDVGLPTSTATSAPATSVPIGPVTCPEGVSTEEATMEGSIDVSHTEPLAAGQPVTWTLSVTSAEDEPVTLVFPSGQDGDVVLERDETVAYRWSEDKFFTEAIRCIDLAPGATLTVELSEQALAVDPGDYTLRATLAASPAPPPAERPVTVHP